MPRKPKQSFDQQKLKELVLYIAYRSQDDPAFGATKLNKLLYFSDFQAYGALERSITGATYQRLDQGPAPRELLPAIPALEREERAKVIEATYLGFPQKRLVPLVEPMLETFAPDEREIVDAVLERLRLLNASEVTQLSHLDVGWRTAGDQEEIPYASALISNRLPSPRERGIAANLVERTARRAGGSR